MQRYLSLILMILATMALVMAISFAVREKNQGRARWYMLFLGLNVALWIGGHGAMEISIDYDMAFLFRVLSLLGIAGYLLTLSLFVLHLIGNKSIVLRIILVAVSVFDVVVYGHRMTVIFTTVDGRVTYYGIKSFGRIFHFFFIAGIGILLIFCALVWLKKVKARRTRKCIRILMLANLVIVVAIIPDTIIPMLGMPAFPSSDFGAFIAYAVFWYYSVNINLFNIGISNLTTYMFESGNTAILVYDSEKQLAVANEYAKGLLHIEDDQQNNGLEALFHLSQEEEDDIFETTRQEGKYSINLRARYQDTPCSFHSSIVIDKFGDPYCMIVFLYDRTIEEKMKNEVIEANKAKSNFLANMSHEIRTPINAVLGIDELIIRESTEKEIIDYARNIQASGKALLSIINDILDFSKIESGKMELVPVEYHVSSLLNDCYHMISMRALEKNLLYETQVDEKIPSVLLGDEVRIRQIIVNLLTNAVKYTPSGSITLCASYRRIAKDKLLFVVEVKDTGIGITKEEQGKLFESFQRIDEKKNRNIEGTGLGLTITKQLITLMGGQIEVESEYGKGSVFRVEIPQKICSDIPIGSFDTGVAETKADYKESFHAPDAKILVTDDVAMNLKVFAGLLKRTQIQIDTACSGMECIEKLYNHSYDMVFLDHLMPHMDGIETMRKWKKSQSAINKDIPIIMLTANAIEGAKEEYLAEGFTDYLTKPIRSELLEEMICRYLPETLIHRAGEEAKEPLDKTVSIEERFPFLDTAQGMEYFAGDEEFYLSMLQDYVTENREAELQQAYEKKDYETIRIITHAIKGISLSIGANEVSEQAKQIEQALKKGDTVTAIACYDEFVVSYHTLIEQLKECFKANDTA